MLFNINKLKDILLAETGWLEKSKGCPVKNLYEKIGPYVGSDNWTKYWQDAKEWGLPNYQGSFYCIETIFWGMVKAYGLKVAQDLCLQKFMINCQVTYELFKKAGQVFTTPKIGDIVVFWNGSRMYHAEFVIDLKGDTVKTFGANTTANSAIRNGGGCYSPKSYSLKALQKAGDKFLRPNYGSQTTEGWIKEGTNWKYQLSDSSFVKDKWYYIKDRWYMFDGAGIMCTGWIYSNGQWYYCCPEVGCMDMGWKLIGGKWYYMDSNGIMRTGWLQDKDKWYYLCDNGEMAVGWKEICGMWYVFGQDGVMLSNTWFLDSTGDWYYLSSTGAMKTSQWIQQENGSFYYVTESGKMAKNSWIKDVYKDKYYFVNADGIYMPEKDVDLATDRYPIVK